LPSIAAHPDSGSADKRNPPSQLRALALLRVWLALLRTLSWRI